MAAIKRREETTMAKDVFRKSSLEDISTPDEMGDYIKVTNPGIWVMLIACIAIAVAVIVWAVVGRIPDTVSARGVIFPSSGTVTVVSPTSGKIQDMRVSTGSTVQPLDIVAVVPQNDIISELEQIRSSETPDAEAISQKELDYGNHSVIRSNVSGLVLSSKNLGDFVSEGEPVATIALMDEGVSSYSVICYMDMTTAKRLNTGMQVQISPTFAPREEYGYMYGYITSIGEYPVTEEDIISTMGGTQYATDVEGGENYVEIHVAIALDSGMNDAGNTAKWSNRAGNELSLTMGTTCDLQIVLKERQPFELVL